MLTGSSCIIVFNKIGGFPWPSTCVGVPGYAAKYRDKIIIDEYI